MKVQMKGISYQTITWYLTVVNFPFRFWNVFAQNGFGLYIYTEKFNEKYS